MRVNVYSQELIPEVTLVSKTSNTGVLYYGVQMMLHSTERLHHSPSDDDRSAITIWLPASTLRRGELAGAFMKMANLVKEAPRETGV